MFLIVNMLPFHPSQGVIMDYSTTQNLTMLPLMRALRVLRVIKIIPKVRGLRLMLETLRWSLPALFNVASVLLLFMFVYVSTSLVMTPSRLMLFLLCMPSKCSAFK